MPLLSPTKEAHRNEDDQDQYPMSFQFHKLCYLPLHLIFKSSGRLCFKVLTELATAKEHATNPIFFKTTGISYCTVKLFEMPLFWAIPIDMAGPVYPVGGDT